MPYVNITDASPGPGANTGTSPSPAGGSQAAGNTQANAAARSASANQSMNSRKDPSVLTNPLARMLSLHQYQEQVYRLADSHPPGFEDGFCPVWECATALLPALQTTQLRINFQREFHLFALTGGQSLGGGFRLQLYDMKKQYTNNGKPGVRLAARGVNFANMVGTGFAPGNSSSQGAGGVFLREPHPFTEPNAQALVIVQNQDTTSTSNQIQVVLFGHVRRFNFPD